MPKGVYQRKPRPSVPFRLEQLGPDDPLPEGEPRRYPDKQGYIRLRWNVGPRHYVEIREHRALLAANAELDVHHLDHNPGNNDPANLVLLTPEEHAALHGREHRKFDRAIAASMYLAGMSTTDIAAHFDINAATVSRGLRVHGITMRPRARYLVRVDEERVEALHAAGLRAEAIARVLRSTPEVVRRVLRTRGLTPHPPGRPPAAMRQIEEALRA